VQILEAASKSLMNDGARVELDPTCRWVQRPSSAASET